MGSSSCLTAERGGKRRKRKLGGYTVFVQRSQIKKKGGDGDSVASAILSQSELQLRVASKSKKKKKKKEEKKVFQHMQEIDSIGGGIKKMSPSFFFMWKRRKKKYRLCLEKCQKGSDTQRDASDIVLGVVFFFCTPSFFLFS